MSNEKVEVDVIRRVYVPKEAGIYIEILPWPEVPGSYLCFRAPGEKNEEWFGRIPDFSMTPEFARALGKALIAGADDLQGERA